MWWFKSEQTTVWTGLKMRQWEDTDNSGCVLNAKSRGLSDQVAQQGGRKNRSRVTQIFAGKNHKATHWDGKTQRRPVFVKGSDGFCSGRAPLGLPPAPV